MFIIKAMRTENSLTYTLKGALNSNLSYKTFIHNEESL